MTPRIEALLSARLFLAPQLAGEHIYFVSNLSGQLSLYRMKRKSSVPQPLLPPDIALQNPELLGGYPFALFPARNELVVMIDKDGDENYQPMRIPLDGGFPEPAFGDFFANDRLAMFKIDKDNGIVYLNAQSRSEPVTRAYRGNLETGKLTLMGETAHDGAVAAANDANTKAALLDGYTVGDTALYLWEEGKNNNQRRLLYGTPLDEREEGQEVPLNALGFGFFTEGDKGLLLTTGLFEDTYGLGYLDLANAAELQRVTINGIQHTGVGELENLDHLHDNRYSVRYNIDGASWLYTGTFDEAARTLTLDTVIVGQGELANGVLEAANYDKVSDSFALSFSTATSPTQLYIVHDGQVNKEIIRLTDERLLGVPVEHLSPGEDASFISHDGLRVSARLYLPAPSLGYEGPRPLVYYVHGGPQSQERPNFAWFSMPLIQFLTLNGFAVFVPNARGSTGYGLAYTKHVDQDWGGQDRLDHVHGMGLLAKDSRVDTKRAAVVGRSYGGYMTLTLAGRHPDLWAAAVDMFGPYDLLSFMDRIPETWKAYFVIALGDPVKDRDFLIERSPKTHVLNLACPLLVIQGKNDPRVVEQESRDLVEALRAEGKDVDYLMFENEGHDVLKLDNRVRCYNAITDFFKVHLKP